MTEGRAGDAYAAYQRAIDEELVRRLGSQPDRPEGFYGMMRYQFGLVDSERPSSGPTAPRSLEPLLCVLTCQACGEDWRAAVRAAAAIELLGGWFEIHRDIEVHNPAAHGRSTLWSLWGDAQAINSGDGLFPIAGLAILDATSNPKLSLTLARELARTAVSYMEGQHMDLNFGNWSEVTAEDYATMLSHKVGALFEYSVWAGAVIASAGEDTARELRSFGAELGLAWHIRCQLDARSRSGRGVTDSEQDTSRKVRVRLGESDAHHRAELAFAALQRVPLERVGREQLEAFAREIVAA